MLTGYFFENSVPQFLAQNHLKSVFVPCSAFVEVEVEDEDEDEDEDEVEVVGVGGNFLKDGDSDWNLAIENDFDFEIGIFFQLLSCFWYCVSTSSFHDVGLSDSTSSQFGV